MEIAQTMYGVLPLAHDKLNRKEPVMIRLALLFLIVALIAGALGLAGVAWLSSQIAWTLFVIFLILFLISLVFGGVRGPAPPP
jgi:uncharacterized membrane protein YtjA (UPF0391 family)